MATVKGSHCKRVIIYKRGLNMLGQIFNDQILREQLKSLFEVTLREKLDAHGLQDVSTDEITHLFTDLQTMLTMVEVASLDAFNNFIDKKLEDVLKRRKT